jgi:hypothetical protein
MSVDFNGTNAKLQLGPTTLTGLSYPVTEFIWFLPDSVSTNYMVAGIGQDGGSDELMIYAEGAGTGKVKAFARDSGTNSSAASTSSIAASWECAMCVHTSASSRSVYYRAGAVVTDTATVLSSLASLDRVVVGVRGKDETLWYSGLAAHYAIWSGGTALGQTQFDALAAGAVPSSVSSGTLWDYWALASNAATHTGTNGRVLTSFGGTTTGASDPPVSSGTPALSSPTVVSTGNGIATVRVTTDTAPSGSSTLAVRTRAAAAPAWTAAEVLASPTATITSGATGARDFNLTGLVNGTALIADFAQTGPSNVVSTASFTPSTVPGAPAIGTAVAGNAQATVNGTAPASNGGAAITGYRSTATPGGSTVTGASLPITHTGLTNGTAYTFTLAAQNANGYGSESAASNSVTPSAPGTAPTITAQPSNQTVTAGATATFSVTATGSGLTYQWRRNGTNIGGATSSSYTTPATTVSGGSANNGDVYSVVVTGDTAPAATSSNATLTVNAGSPPPPPPPGTFTALTDIIAESGIPKANTLVYFTWCPAGRPGAIAGPVNSSVTTDAAGRALISHSVAGAGLVIIGTRPGPVVSNDRIFAQFLTLA